MPTATPTPSSNIILNFGFISSLGPTLALLLQVVALTGAAYGFARALWDLGGWLRRPRLRVYMSDELWPVGEENHSEFAINIQFVAYNPAKRMAALRRLEGTLIRPEFTAQYPRKTFGLRWRRFIKGNPLGFEQTEPVFVSPVKPRDSAVLAVQLRGQYVEADSFHVGHFDWFPGQYTLHLYGLVNRRRVQLSPSGGFVFQISEIVSGQLSPVNPIGGPFARSVQLES
jgi:hypothetical protein